MLGGVAPRPWRVQQAEKALLCKSLNADTIEQAANLAVLGAKPLRQNAYKILLLKGIIVEALSALK